LSTLRSPLFHITQVVDRLDEALDCHRRLFRRQPLHGGYWEVPQRQAFFTFVGGVWIEAMAPDLRGGKLRAFVDRFGSRLHSLAWYVRGIDDIAEELRRRGVEVQRLSTWSGAGSDIIKSSRRVFDLCDEFGAREMRYDSEGMGSGVRAACALLKESLGA